MSVWPLISVVIAESATACLFVSCRPQVQAFVDGLFDVRRDLKAYKSHLRDFLIEVLVSISRLACSQGAHVSCVRPFSLQQFKTEESEAQGDDLFAEERSAAAAMVAQQELERRRAVPGLLNPYAVGQPAEMDDL